MKAALFSILLAGCSWTVFDDLEGSTWVTATEKPSNDSTNWGIALARAQASGSGGRIVVLGGNQALFSELQVASNGKITTPPTTLGLGSMFGIANLDVQPILVADPSSNDVSLVTPSGNNSIAAFKFTTGSVMMAGQIFGTGVTGTPDGAVYMIPATGQPAQLLIAEGDRVYGPIATPQLSCKIVDDAMAAVQIRAIGSSQKSDGTSNPLVWTASGKLMRFPPTIAAGMPAGCATGLAPGANAFATTAFMPGKGSQILTFETTTGRYALLKGQTDTGSAFLALYDAETMMPVGQPNSQNGTKSAALMELGGKRYVVAGAPAAIVEGTGNAGQVQVFEVDTTTGVSGTASMTLADAQPEGDQAFGRSVAVMPFDGKPLIVVGADNEVFTYFRTLLYEETRAR